MKIVSIDIGIKNFAWYVSNGTELLFDVTDLSNGETNADVTINIRQRLATYLQSKKDNAFQNADVILVEQQFIRRGRVMNLKAVKICECTLMWFISNFPNACVVLFDSKHKTHALGAPKGLKEYDRKKWTTERFIALLEEREDVATLDALKRLKCVGKQKLSDIADAAMQCEAYKKINNIIA